MSYTPFRSIEGTVAAITGASAGIGAATARALVAVSETRRSTRETGVLTPHDGRELAAGA